ncbi:hypothetical protein Dimus_004959, partial [Dionaea muscipula]
YKWPSLLLQAANQHLVRPDEACPCGRWVVTSTYAHAGEWDNTRVYAHASNKRAADSDERERPQPSTERRSGEWRATHPASTEQRKSASSESPASSDGWRAVELSSGEQQRSEPMRSAAFHERRYASKCSH